MKDSLCRGTQINKKSENILKTFRLVNYCFYIVFSSHTQVDSLTIITFLLVLTNVCKFESQLKILDEIISLPFRE